MTARTLITAVGAALASAVLAGCGGGGAAAPAPPPSAPGVQGAFLASMLGHNQLALEPIAIAVDRAESIETRKLAATMRATREREIREVQALHERLFATPLVNDPEEPLDAARLVELELEVSDLGLPAEDSSFTEAPLDTAEPFDRAFFDVMVANDHGALRLAASVGKLRAASEKPDEIVDDEVARLAASIVQSRACEIIELNERRRLRHGLPAPAGDIPRTGSRQELGRLRAGC